MRVLQVGRFYPPDNGGVETVMQNLAEGAHEVSIRTDVLCSNKARTPRVERHNGFFVVRLPSFGIVSSVSIAPGYFTVLRRIASRYDIIHLHHPDPIAALATLLARPKCPIVIHWHSDIIRQRIGILLYLPFQKWLLRVVSRVIVTSPNYLSGSRHLAPWRSKCICIPIGIVNFKNDHIHPRALRGLTFPASKVVLTIGRLVYYKGFEYLIEAAEHMPREIVILIGGTGPRERKLRKLISRKGLADRVFLLGHVPQSDMAGLIAACDIFCLPSIVRTEAFGIVLLEAMSLGKPLVTTDLPGSGVPWVNQNNETGITVPVMDTVQLAKAISLLASDPELRQKYGQAGAMRYAVHFTRRKMVGEIAGLYRSLLTQSAMKPS
jgi:rhamnosyl/mannosyltransferase